MSFLFGSTPRQKEKLDRISDLLDTDDTTQTVTVKDVIKFRETEIQKYIPVFLEQFVTPQNANIKPKKLKVTFKSYNKDLIKSCTVYWVTVPLVNNKEYRPDDFKNKEEFDDEFSLLVPPMMTLCQVDEKGHLVGADCTHITNLNMFKNTQFHVSIGSMYLVLSRETSGKASIEVEYTLTYSLRQY